MTALLIALLTSQLCVDTGAGRPICNPRLLKCRGQLACSSTGSGIVTLTVDAGVLGGEGPSIPDACAAGEVLTSNGTALVCTAAITANNVSCTNCVQSAEVEGEIPLAALASVANALAVNPTACGANNWVNDIAADGTLTCAQPGFSNLSGSASDGQIPNNITIDLAAAATALANNPTDCNPGDFATGIAANGNLTCATPASGSDPWTYLTVNGGSDFLTSSATAVDVTGLTLTVSANTKYEFECKLLLRSATTATVNPRLGFAWSTGLTDGVAVIQESQAANTAPLYASGNPNAALLIAVGGLPNTTQSWPAFVNATFVAGASPGGTTRVQLASETAATNVTIKSVGSFCRYRTRP